MFVHILAVETRTKREEIRLQFVRSRERYANGDLRYWHVIPMNIDHDECIPVDTLALGGSREEND